MNNYWEVRNQAGDRAELRIYGVIENESFFLDDVTPSAVLEALDGVTAPEMDVRINSPGGNVFAGMAIYNGIHNHPARATVYVDGLAASAASMIAMAGDTIIMGNAALMMVHNPLALIAGDAAELRKEAAVLDKIADTAASVYSARSGLSMDRVRELMDAETWMDSRDAIALGFADSDGAERAQRSLRAVLQPSARFAVAMAAFAAPEDVPLTTTSTVEPEEIPQPVVQSAEIEEVPLPEDEEPKEEAPEEATLRWKRFVQAQKQLNAIRR